MTSDGVIYTAPSHAYAACPDGWPSLNACKQSLHHDPLLPPVDWVKGKLLLEGRGQRPATVYLHPHMSANEAMALIEQKTSKKIKKIWSGNEVETRSA